MLETVGSWTICAQLHGNDWILGAVYHAEEHSTTGDYSEYNNKARLRHSHVCSALTECSALGTKGS